MEGGDTTKGRIFAVDSDLPHSKYETRSSMFPYSILYLYLLEPANTCDSG